MPIGVPIGGGNSAHLGGAGGEGEMAGAMIGRSRGADAATFPRQLSAITGLEPVRVVTVRLAASLILFTALSTHFRPWRIDQSQLLPPSVADFVPPGHLSRFIVPLVRESLDRSEIMANYTSGLGPPPFDPHMMTALLLNAYASGIYSSRRIARACVERADFMMIAALDPPDFHTISDFRKRHLKALAALFVQVLKLAEKAGLVKLG